MSTHTTGGVVWVPYIQLIDGKKYKCKSGDKLPKSLLRNQTKVVSVAHPNENKQDKNKCNHKLLGVPDYHLHKDNNDWL
jgi:hypothetical protein